MSQNNKSCPVCRSEIRVGNALVGCTSCDWCSAVKPHKVKEEPRWRILLKEMLSEYPLHEIQNSDKFKEYMELYSNIILGHMHKLKPHLFIHKKSGIICITRLLEGSVAYPLVGSFVLTQKVKTFRIWEANRSILEDHQDAVFGIALPLNDPVHAISLIKQSWWYTEKFCNGNIKRKQFYAIKKAYSIHVKWHEEIKAIADKKKKGMKCVM